MAEKFKKYRKNLKKNPEKLKKKQNGRKRRRKISPKNYWEIKDKFKEKSIKFF